MSDLPVDHSPTNTTDNASDYTIVLADMDIIDNISGDYGQFVHDTNNMYTYGDEINTLNDSI